MSWRIDLRGELGPFRVKIQCDLGDGLVQVIGPNGSGKSTLLRAIVGARLSLEGRLIMNGRTLFDSSQGIDVAPHLRGVGYVPQGYALFPHLTALENVAFGCRGPSGRDRAREILRRFDLAHLESRFPAVLSGGEKQRVALARAVATSPEALLLDEPLAALDPRIRRTLRQDLVRHLAEEGLPAIIVTHDLRDVRAFGGVVVVLEDGEVVQTGSPDELAAHPSGAFAAEFFGA